MLASHALHVVSLDPETISVAPPGTCKAHTAFTDAECPSVDSPTAPVAAAAAAAEPAAKGAKPNAAALCVCAPADPMPWLLLGRPACDEEDAIEGIGDCGSVFARLGWLLPGELTGLDCTCSLPASTVRRCHLRESNTCTHASTSPTTSSTSLAALKLLLRALALVVLLLVPGVVP